MNTPVAPKPAARKNIETRNDKKNRPLMDHPGLETLKQTLDRTSPIKR